MGLSSSQARLLTLTSRQHAIEYKAQRIQAEKLQLANDSDKVYQDYLNKLDAKKIQYRVVNNDGSMYFTDAKFEDLKKAGYLFNVGGTICYTLQQVEDALKTQRILEGTTGTYNFNDSYTLLTTLISEGYVVLMEVGDDTNTDYYYKDGKICDQATNGTKIDYSGGSKSDTVIFDSDKTVYDVLRNTSVSTSTTVQEVSDEKELKKAEAQYEADMNKINNKDSRYDTELSQLETERNAIKNEIDTLKTVAGDNVDRTFKLFT